MSSQNIPLVQLLNSVSFQVNRYFAIVIFVFGIVGNLLNCLVLSQNPLRKNPCAFLFLTASIASIISILSGLVTRILAGWVPDLSSNIDWLCRFRVFIVFTSRTIALWSIALAGIDRWFSSSVSSNRRKQSSLKRTYRNLGLLFLITMLLYIHVSVCYAANLTNSPLRCYAKNVGCRLVTDLIYAIISIEAPIMVMIVFGLLTIKNVRRSSNRVFIMTVTHAENNVTTPRQQSKWKKTDSHLLLMLLIQTLLFSFFTLPQAIQRMYSTFTENTPKSPLQIAIENLIFNLLLLFTYFSNGIPFYVFTLCGNTIFRKTLFNILRKPCQQRA